MPQPKRPTKPELWEAIHKKARASSAGSKPGEWSPRKSVLAQLEYKKRGGDWKTTGEESS